MRRRYVALLMAFSFLIGSGGMYVGKSIVDKKEARQNAIQQAAIEAANATNTRDALSQLEQVYEIINKDYFKKVDDAKLVKGAINGMISELDDPYSTYMSVEKATAFTQSLDSNFEGIGAEVSMESGKLMIISPIKGSPAEKAGLKPRDEVLTIDGKSIKGLSQQEAVMKIRGKKGTIVKLGVKRPGVNNPITFNITRDTIAQKSVYDKVHTENGKKIVVLQITSFAEKTATEFLDLLAKHEKEGVDGLVIDVRGNPGGYLKSVEEILGALVSSDKPYVMTEDRNGKRNPVYSSLKKKKTYPISVLIDKGSASASEILAAALKEAGGYDAIGENSFGKGTVQQTMPMEDGSTLKLTIQKWLTPDGNWIHKKGIKPTVEVKQPGYFYLSPLQVEKPLKPDTNDEKVKVAQQTLKAAGFDPGREDGYYSASTVAAVKAFQKSINMKQTGILDKDTVVRLESVILDKVRDDQNDLQLKKAIEVTATK